MTAVNWMIEKLLERHSGTLGNEYVKIFEQAKEMEKEQVVNAYKNGQKIVEQYYNETYGSKGSDGNFKQFSLYEHKETITSADTITSYQTEISDVEIEKAAWEYYTDENRHKGSERLAFRLACTWYKEKLKNK